MLRSLWKVVDVLQADSENRELLVLICDILLSYKGGFLETGARLCIHFEKLHNDAIAQGL